MEYLSPRSMDEALALLQKYGEKAIPVAGGTFFMSHRDELFTEVEALVDVKRLGLDYVRAEDGGLAIGAITSLASILESSLVEQGPWRVICDAIRGIEIPEIRNMATLGGAVLIGGAGDMPIPLLAMDAGVVIRGPGGRRTLSLDEFYLGFLSTALGPGEIITEIRVPRVPDRTGSAFAKFTRVAVDLPIVNAAARITLEGGNRCRSVKIVLGGTADVPKRAEKAERLLANGVINEQTITEAIATLDEIEYQTDIRASGELRQRWAKAAVKRVLHEAARRAGGSD